MSNTLREFSWNRVRVALIFFEKSGGSFRKDGTLFLPFLHHRHEVWISTNGRGLLYNPWDEDSVRYHFLAPKDVQDMVVSLYEKYTQPVQDKELN